MADPALKGNNRPCKICGGTGKIRGSSALRCQTCNGRGFTPLPDAQIVKLHAKEACAVYWPAFDARTNGGQRDNTFETGGTDGRGS